MVAPYEMVHGVIFYGMVFLKGLAPKKHVAIATWFRGAISSDGFQILVFRAWFSERVSREALGNKSGSFCEAVNCE